MSSLRLRFTGAALTVGGVATTAALLFPGTASADPTELVAPLLNSDCTFAQVDAALHDKNPQLAAVLDANPEQKAMLQQKFDQPVEQRRAELQQYAQEHPDQAQRAENDPRAESVRATVQAVADSCHSY
ncbi:hemophore-related protein [Nocardia blacklockiae]|uniref:hemophore-related protein n=1 Tax=Nocardia blacklockiae TaxID=480036 RepID=UPI001896237F|nr:hemophore-related protein [Nocardia blacklockiae]MBF6171626.1 hemophore-related protein [Nocardia blacklockiae]